MAVLTRLAVVAGLLIAGISVWLLWLSVRDPLLALPPPDLNVRAETVAVTYAPGRRIEQIRLRSHTLGDITLALSLPDPLPPGRLPVLFVLGGLRYGKDSIAVLKNAGPNVVIGYDWPMPVRFPQGTEFLLQTPDLVGRALSIPGQGATALSWAASQPWADNQRLVLLGFSLGALAAPAVQNVAARNGTQIGWTVLAYGGAPLAKVFDARPYLRPAWLHRATSPLIGVLLRPLEPELHLPQLSGRFLILEGQDDALIPLEARNRLRESVPEPRTTITLQGGHIGIGRQTAVLMEQVVRICRVWLAEQGAIDPLR